MRQDYNFSNRIQKGWIKIFPWFHIIGLVIAVIFLSGSYWAKLQAKAEVFDAHEGRISTLETNYTRIDQKLNDIMNFWHIPRRDHGG